MRRGLRTALARSLLVGGTLVASVLAGGGLTTGGLAMSTGTAAAPGIVHQVRHFTPGETSSGADRSATWASSNWSGYAETGTFATITGSWTVPSVTAGASASSGGGRRFGGRGTTSAWYSAAWLGIDGFNNGSLIQTGTEQDYYNGSAHYAAWWEILPAAETVISKPVSSGDAMTATIAKTSATITVKSGGRHGGTTTENEWQITLNDVTQGWSFTTTQAYTGPGTSAEWIVEAPSVNGQIASLANYAFPSGSAGAGDFHNATVSATVGGTLTGAGLNYGNDSGVMIQNNAQVSTPGQPDGPETAFNSLYGASAPPEPTT